MPKFTKPKYTTRSANVDVNKIKAAAEAAADDTLSNTNLAAHAAILVRLVLDDVIIPIKNDDGDIIAIHSPDSNGITGTRGSRWSNGTLHVGDNEEEVKRSCERFAAFKEACSELVNNPMFCLRMTKVADSLKNELDDAKSYSWGVIELDNSIYLIQDEDNIFTEGGEYVTSISNLDASDIAEAICKAHAYDKATASECDQDDDDYNYDDGIDPAYDENDNEYGSDII
jgi:hypothetical protein